MNGRDLIDAIITANSQSLKYSYVALTKTSMQKMISSKVLQTSDKLFKNAEIDRYDLYLKEMVDQITITDDQLRLEILLLLAKKLEIEMNYLDTNKGLVDFGDKILNKAVKEYKTTDKKFTGDSMEQLIHYQLEKMFKEIDKKYKTASSSEKKSFEKNVTEFISQLPQDQQDKLRAELGIEDFSQKVISNVLATGGASIIFSSIVNTMGFSFYMGATSLLASSAGLFGLTLPFAAYTTMTSVIAVIAAPLFIIGFLTFSGVIYTKQKSKLDKMMIPLTLMQLLLAYLSTEQSQIPSYEVLTEQWTEYMSGYKNVLKEHAHLSNQLSALENKTRMQKLLIKQQTTEISTCTNDIQNMKNKIKLYVKEHDISDVSNLQEFRKLNTEILGIKEEINKLSRKEIGSTGILSVIKAHAVNTGNMALSQERAWKLTNSAEKMVEIILSHSINVCYTEQDYINSSKQKQRDYQYLLQQTNSEDKNLINEIKETERKQKDNLYSRDRYIEKYYGIENLDF